ncbi:MAG: metallophosphoesterase [Bacteroidota bacterium]|nr:metallophosphoesterase [Bacteroidota bacterium]MDX5427473.1 metallophosphoesterase [Bacteroidota bacterium]MDX5449372.1 metallophosphoesterase [Bacteroidota bacterium]MDX5505408.1 metallophosphoesterase [Bacteroidota bacterium]
MAGALGVFALLLLFMFLIDLYFYQGVRTIFYRKLWVPVIFWSITGLGYAYVLYTLTAFDPAASPRKVINPFIGYFILFYIPKLLVIILLLSEDLFRIFWGGVRALRRKITGSKAKPLPERSGPTIPSRRKFISQVALGLAAVPFGSIMYGMWKGKYDFRVIRKVIYFDDLPDAFDGFVIAQLSDVHSGSFDDKEKVQYGVDLLNEQKADLFVFTGDLVNNRAEEMMKWMDTFGSIRAPFGQFSILGNHDYGDYVTWSSDEAKESNMEDLYQVHQDLGFDLLRNEHRILEKDGQKLLLAGVENWGHPPFPQKGDLDKALKGSPEDAFTVLLSHDPTHFDEKVKVHSHKVHLTLSGHTHGMQFGIEIPGWIKWSPVKYRYPKWAGLYEDLGKYLYVNRGFGYLAFPGRVGIWPEITLLELRKA